MLLNIHSLYGAKPKCLLLLINAANNAYTRGQLTTLNLSQFSRYLCNFFFFYLIQVRKANSKKLQIIILLVNVTQTYNWPDFELIVEMFLCVSSRIVAV